MTLPLFLVDADTVSGVAVGAVVLLDGPEGRHAATVRRIGVGELVQVTDGTGLRLTAEVVGAERDALRLRVTELHHDPEPPLRLVLVQALAKGDRDEQAIEAATELGVDEVVPWQASRSIVQWRGERGSKARRKWESTVLAAAKQSRRSRVPVVGDLVTTRGLADRAAGGTMFVLHEEATTSLAAQTIPARGEVLLVIGPEGGISPDELAALARAGATVVRLGETVLRSSSAGPAGLAVVLASSRWR